MIAKRPVLDDGSMVEVATVGREGMLGMSAVGAMVVAGTRPRGEKRLSADARIFVAMMLGASRPTVTVVAGTLQKAGLITYHRGHVTIVDREKLESASCECCRAGTDLLKNVIRTAKDRVEGPR